MGYTEGAGGIPPQAQTLLQQMLRQGAGGQAWEPERPEENSLVRGAALTGTGITAATRGCGDPAGLVQAALPYLSPACQRQLFCLLKLWEVQQFCPGPAPQTGQETGEEPRRALLQALLPWLPERERGLVQLLFNL